jgi:hypothetical protein
MGLRLCISRNTVTVEESAVGWKNVEDIVGIWCISGGVSMVVYQGWYLNINNSNGRVAGFGLVCYEFDSHLMLGVWN